MQHIELENIFFEPVKNKKYERNVSLLSLNKLNTCNMKHMCNIINNNLYVSENDLLLTEPCYNIMNYVTCSQTHIQV